MYRGLHYDFERKAIVSDFGNAIIVPNIYEYEDAFELINSHLIGVRPGKGIKFEPEVRVA